jgi:hypothetical protein
VPSRAHVSGAYAFSLLDGDRSIVDTSSHTAYDPSNDEMGNAERRCLKDGANRHKRASYKDSFPTPKFGSESGNQESTAEAPDCDI